MSKTYYSIISSLYCDIILVADEKGLLKIHLATHEGKRQFKIEPHWIKEESPFKEANKQLKEYFSGQRTTFDLRLHLIGTEFQKKVWNTLLTIPFGEVRSYKQIAKQIGNEKASRAIGMANHKNPLPLIVPCHRVISSNGKLAGFAQGLKIKQQLLDFEKESLLRQKQALFQ